MKQITTKQNEVNVFLSSNLQTFFKRNERVLTSDSIFFSEPHVVISSYQDLQDIGFTSLGLETSIHMFRLLICDFHQFLLKLGLY